MKRGGAHEAAPMFFKQPPVAESESADPADLPSVAEAESAETANRLPAERESADPAARWQLLGKCKTVRSLAEAVIRQQTDEQLHSISIKVVLDDVLAKANGKISMAELVQEKDAFIAATMAVVPQLLSAVKKPQLASGRPATIDSQCVQKTYLLAFSNLDPSSAPARQTILDAVLKAFDIADYGSTAYITHAGVFREQHCSGQWHFHVATALSVPCRWAGWKRELAKAGYVAHFANMSIDDHSSTESSKMLTCCGTFGCRVRRKVCQPWTRTHYCIALGAASIRRFWTQSTARWTVLRLKKSCRALFAALRCGQTETRQIRRPRAVADCEAPWSTAR